MAFQVSPGVNVSEIDLTTVIPAVSTSVAAMAGVYRWGPVNKRTLVSSEIELVSKFGKPTNLNSETFFTAASFLAYGNSLYNVRAVQNLSNTAQASAVNVSSSNTTILVNDSTNITAGMILVVGNDEVNTGIASNTRVVSVTNTTAIVVNKAPSNTVNGLTVSFVTGNTAVSALAIGNNNSNSTYGAVANATEIASATVLNEDDYLSKTFSEPAIMWVAKYPGELGNSLEISVCDSANAYLRAVANVSGGDANVNQATIVSNIGNNTITIAMSNTALGTLAEANTKLNNILSSFQVDDYIEIGNSSIGKQYLKIVSVPTTMGTNASFANASHRFFSFSVEEGHSLREDFTLTDNGTGFVNLYWKYFNLVDVAPGTSSYQSTYGNTSAKDEIHIIVSDKDGEISGTPGSVLEVYKGLSRSSDAKTSDGGSNYYRTVINERSQYIWFANHRNASYGGSSNYSNTASNLSSIDTKANYINFLYGNDGDGETDIPLGKILTGYDQYVSPEEVDISLLLTGKSRGGTNGELITNYLVDNIAEVRKDCIVLTSPEKADVVNNVSQDEVDDVVTFRNSCRSSSYLVIDSGYKYMYDKYNDVFRWVPLNGDIAGLCARTDTVRDPWFSPAGFNRGQIKNLVKLSYNPDKADRDVLYKNGVNPVATFTGQGTVLFGDKTALAKPSAFDRINVRRLFIVLEKAISNAARASLFEFNDEFTRAQFISLVEPFLRDVQGRRGIFDYRVVCDETNNTAQVIDANQFVGDIYIKPAKSINFIQLNFVAVRSGVAFDEIVGKF